ncbi:angiopoietin-1 receptor-like [Anneissia japonica]|uniref:angiopoietin-1 receptor-like n=1 Tax=Anneissia japonica TaxID=1529436 RepID=UPI0014257556|nr:angiopoietin-1 receptor-like [Anneissia japonica]
MEDFCKSVTLINATPRFGSRQTLLRCLDTSEYYVPSQLEINRSYDNGYGQNLPAPATLNYTEGVGSVMVRWGEDLGASRAGVFECSATGSDIRVQTIKTASNGIVFPMKLSMTVNKGDRVDVVMRMTGQTFDQIVWRRNNVELHPSKINVSLAMQQTYTILSADVIDSGVYEAYPNNSRSLGALTLLIVRECEDGKWNPPLCDQTCNDCSNGGVCDHATGTCICPPGFRGVNCEIGE